MSEYIDLYDVDRQLTDENEICRMMDEGRFIPFGKELIRYLFVAREDKGTWREYTYQENRLRL